MGHRLLSGLILLACEEAETERALRANVALVREKEAAPRCWESGKIYWGLFPGFFLDRVCLSENGTVIEKVSIARVSRDLLCRCAGFIRAGEVHRNYAAARTLLTMILFTAWLHPLLDRIPDSLREK